MNFDEWFNEQFGPDPTPDQNVYDWQLAVAAAAGNLARCEHDLALKYEWESRRDAALRAWVAREDYLKEEAE